MPQTPNNKAKAEAKAKADAERRQSDAAMRERAAQRRAEIAAADEKLIREFAEQHLGLKPGEPLTVIRCHRSKRNDRK